MTESVTNWDVELLGMAFYWAARRSKDPSTKVGAVIADEKRRIVGTGYNGFPRGCSDAPELYADRNAKLHRTMHAELNAILTARRALDCCTICVSVPSPFSPVCSRAQCAGAVIQSGISRIVWPHIGRSSFGDRWEEDCGHAIGMFKEVGITLVPVPEPLWRALPIEGLASRVF